jgi:hypothetical protein
LTGKGSLTTKQGDIMNYEELFNHTLRTVKDLMKNHEEFPLNGYRDKAFGADRLFLELALRMDVTEEQRDKDLNKLKNILFGK